MMCDFTLTVRVKVGMLIREAVISALMRAIALDMNIEFMFNGIRVFVTPTSDVEKVLAGYQNNFKRTANDELA